MIKRRSFVIALGAGALVAPLGGFAQQQKVIGYLANDKDPRASESVTYTAFVDELRTLGWSENKNLKIIVKGSGGQALRFRDLAAELVRDNVDVIVTGGSAATLAAKAATTRIPIVFGSAQNPVQETLVTSLARPGGNVTGLAIMVEELRLKRYELLKEIFPRASVIARLYQPNNNARDEEMKREEDGAAREVGMALQHVSVTRLEDLDAAFDSVARNRVDAINVKTDPVFGLNRGAVAKLALRHRLPMMSADKRFTEAGGLVSYGENFATRYRRAAVLVDKILRGAKPADLPVEQPTVVELVVNRKTAKALGLAIPNSILVRAHQVID